MPRALLFALPLALLLVVPVQAQRVTIDGLRPGGDQQGEIRVQVTMNFFIASVVDDSEASVKAQESARRVLYASAGTECEVLRSAIASECRLDSVNVNVHRQQQAQQSGFNVTGNFGYRIRLK